MYLGCFFVFMWLNGHPLKTPYDPVRGVQEPGAYLSASTERVMMPVRFFTEAFGGWAAWDNRDQKAWLFLRGTLVQIRPGQETAIVGAGYFQRIDQAPVLFQGRLYVPVRFLAEAYGAEVKWDHANRGARIQLLGALCTNKTYCGEVR